MITNFGNILIYVVVLVEGVLDKKKYIQVKSGFEIE
jgi:hypothetical protein